MKSLRETLRGGTILVSDGAWGTFLQAKGLVPGECPEFWNLTHRSDVLDIARSYIEAGADMVETNSFGANRFKLAHYGLEDRVRALNRAAAEISREAAGTEHHVLGSVGPTGVILMTGEVSEEELYEAFREQAVALEEGGADACCIETFSAIDEAVCAIRAVRDHTRLEIICTFTFDRTVDGTYRTMMGVSPAAMAEAVADAGAHIIGTNCGNGMELMIGVVRELRGARPDVPILVHANAGLPELKAGAVVFPDTPERMAALAAEVVRAGASIVGGCCGTTPAHIRALVEALTSQGTSS